MDCAAFQHRLGVVVFQCETQGILKDVVAECIWFQRSLVVSATSPSVVLSVGRVLKKIQRSVEKRCY